MYQSTTIIGRLGREPEMRYMPTGDPVTSFSVATDRQWNGKDGSRQKETTWFRVSVFGKQAENVNQYLHKGSMVLVEGRLGLDVRALEELVEDLGQRRVRVHVELDVLWVVVRACVCVCV